MKKFALLTLVLFMSIVLTGCEKNYVITFNIQEDTLYYEVECLENESIPFPEDPDIDGFTFDAWYTSDDYLVEINQKQVCTSDMVLYGKLTQVDTASTRSYTLTFVDYDGTILQTTTLDEGSATTQVSLPNDPVRTGYTFDGWDNELPLNMPSNDITITALYTQNTITNTYTVQYLNVDGSVIEEADFEVGESTTKMTIPPLPSTVGYTILDWNQNLPPIMPAENVVISPVYYSSNTFTKELGNINEHSFNVEGDYLLYIINNYNWSIEESVREASTLNILKLSDPSYHRVIPIDKANAYAYTVLVNESKIIVSSPQYDNGYGTGAIYFYDLLDTEYEFTLTEPFSNVRDFGNTLVMNEDGSQLVVGYSEYIATTDSTYGQFKTIDISSTPTVTGFVSDNYVSEHPWEYGGVSYKDFYVITKDLGTDIVVEVKKFSDTNYSQEFSLNTELEAVGLSGIDDLVFYQKIENGIHSNPLSVGGTYVYYTVNLTGDDPTFAIYQNSDIPNAASGFMMDFHLLEEPNYSVIATNFYDGNTGVTATSITIQDTSNNTIIELIDENLLDMSTVNNILILTTRTYDPNSGSTSVHLYMYDTSNPSDFSLINSESFPLGTPISATDGSNYVLLFIAYTGIDTILHIDVENLIQD